MKQVQFLILFNIVLIQRESYGFRQINSRESAWHYTNPQQWQQRQPNTNEDDGYYHDTETANGFSTQYLSPAQSYNNPNYANESFTNSNYGNANYGNLYNENPNYGNTNNLNSNHKNPNYGNTHSSQNYGNVNYANDRLTGQVNPQTLSSQVAYNNFQNQQYAPTNYPATTTSGQRQYNLNMGNTGQRLPVPAAIGEFGLKMLQIANQQKNLVMSPYSVTSLLALLQQGSRGATLQQISSALQMSNEVAATGFRQFTNTLKTRRSRGNILNIANNVFLSTDLSLNQDFEQKARNNFGSEVTSLNFGYSSDAVQKINDWVSRATNNNINQLVSPGFISSNTQLVLVNALYFKGLWQMKFRPQSTLSREFYVNGVQKKPTYFMRARKNYRYGEDSSSQIVVLPFENAEYTLTIVLPSQKTSVDQIIQTLTYDKLAAYQSFTLQDVDLEIPKFSVRSDTDLQPLFTQMGITNMFGGSSELFGIVNKGYNSPQVSSAIHSAMLSIDEEGGTASAATAFTVVALSYNTPDAVFKADRPFLAVLWDTKLSLPLIMAKIEDPTLS